MTLSFAKRRAINPAPLIRFILFALVSAGLSAAPIPSGWTCSGNCGTNGADGVVGLSPFAGTAGYQWVSTSGSGSTGALSGVGGSGSPTNGSTLSTPLFTVGANASLTFYFNYVTSDGAGFADYAWARLLDSSGTQVALLFTSRTAPTGSIVPGFSMPNPSAILAPPSVPIIGGGPSWSPLGSDSGSCFDDGCGYTGWIQSTYTIVNAGSYRLEVGVTNWDDEAYASGLALDGVVAGGTVISPDTTGTPEPSMFLISATGLLFVASVHRRRRHRR